MGFLDLDRDPFTGKKKTSGRDKRRAFTRTQQKQILYQQNSKCSRCKKKLDPRATSFHHAKPWADRGKTITENGRAVCGTCHDILTHKERLKKVDKPKKSSAQKKKSMLDEDIFGLPTKKRGRKKKPKSIFDL